MHPYVIPPLAFSPAKINVQPCVLTEVLSMKISLHLCPLRFPSPRQRLECTFGWCLHSLQNICKQGSSLLFLNQQTIRHTPCSCRCVCVLEDRKPCTRSRNQRHLGNFFKSLVCVFRTCSGPNTYHFHSIMDCSCACSALWLGGSDDNPGQMITQLMLHDNLVNPSSNVKCLVFTKAQ